MVLKFEDTNGDGNITVDEVAAEIDRALDSGRNNGKQIVDTHYTPLQPNAYIDCRVETALTFYSNRIPKNGKTMKIGKTILVIGSMVGVVLVLLHASMWAAAVSIFTSGVTAWLEFNGTLSKTSRYSAVVNGLQKLVVWWRTLDLIDQSVVSNIDYLVLTTEDIIRGEHEVWASMAARTTKMLDEAAADAAKK